MVVISSVSALVPVVMRPWLGLLVGDYIAFTKMATVSFILAMYPDGSGERQACKRISRWRTDLVSKWTCFDVFPSRQGDARKNAPVKLYSIDLTGYVLLRRLHSWRKLLTLHGPHYYHKQHFFERKDYDVWWTNPIYLYWLCCRSWRLFWLLLSAFRIIQTKSVTNLSAYMYIICNLGLILLGLVSILILWFWLFLI